MTNESNSGPKSSGEDDPLSATAMFFRTLDQQSGSKPAEPVAKFDFGALGSAPAGQEEPPAPSSTGSDGEFTAIFGSRSSAASPAPSSAPSTPAPSEVFPPAWPQQEPPVKQGQGEFTRIFVKGASAAPKPRVSEPAPDAAPPRAKGFSSPGVSDAASAQTSFSQFFKPAAKSDSAPVQPSSAGMFHPEKPRPSSSPDPFRSDSPFASPATEPKASGQDQQSITGLIQSLSSQASSGAGARVSETTPYRSESQPAFQPVAKAPATPEFESGGVTQFIQRLAEMPPAAPAEAPAAPPIREQDSGPGEYTRIISAPSRSAASAPATAPPSSPAAAPPLPSPAFARPVLPAMPAAPAMPVAPAFPPAPAMAPHPAPMPGMQPPVVPALHPPPMPATPAVAAPKGKLEALVPILLVVNTFLLVVILVVMIFLIKAK